jgi:hypothetical protein
MTMAMMMTTVQTETNDNFESELMSRSRQEGRISVVVSTMMHVRRWFQSSADPVGSEYKCDVLLFLSVVLTSREFVKGK